MKIKDHLATSPLLISIWRMLKSKGVKIRVIGKQNKIRRHSATLKRVTINIEGSRNAVIFGEGTYLYNVQINISGDDNVVDIGPQTFISVGSSVVISASHCQLSIGHGSSIRQASFQIAEPATRIKIGNNCLLAEEVVITNSDWHSVIDLETGLRINQAKNIELEDHVWLAFRVQVLKGVVIGKESIIGTGSIVTKNVPAYSLAAGVPAKVIKSGVRWDSELRPL